MPLLELPHTAGCLVCGRANRIGMHLDLHVDDQTGIVQAKFAPAHDHIGFQGVIHGGVLATVVDEAMVWAATWNGRRFCLCAELTMRYLQIVRVDQKVTVVAKVETSRSRLKTVSALIRDDDSGNVLATGSGKYVPVSPDEHARVIQTLVPEAGTQSAAEYLVGL